MIPKLIIGLPLLSAAIIFDIIFIRKNVEKLKTVKFFRIKPKNPKGNLISSATYSLVFCALFLPHILDMLGDNYFVLSIVGIVSLFALFVLVEIFRFLLFKLMVNSK